MKHRHSQMFAHTIRALPAAMVLMLGLSPAAHADAYRIQNGSPAGSYQIDPAHSSVNFSVGHLGVSEVQGRFDQIAGKFKLDPAHPDQAQVAVQVPVASLDTNLAQRNKDLMGPDFFNVKQFPVMRFVGTRFQPQGPDRGLLSGNLTLHGVTRPVTFAVRHVGAGPDPWGGYRSGYVATATIKRSDFGMRYLLNGVSDAVAVRMNIEGKRQ